MPPRQSQMTNQPITNDPTATRTPTGSRHREARPGYGHRLRGQRRTATVAPEVCRRDRMAGHFELEGPELLARTRIERSELAVNGRGNEHHAAGRSDRSARIR